ncbi:MAG: hypothetical protein M3N24_00340 [Actinomycetota bacterium]|nr:hypothetical protein [Actinomycetota bacterium]
MTDLREALERERRRFRMGGTSIEDLERRRDARRRNRRVVSGVVAIAVAAVGAFAAFAAFHDTGRAPSPAASPPIATPKRIPPPSSKLQFVDENHGWMAVEHEILATTDGGRTWKAQYRSEDVFGVQFLDSEHGWAASAEGLVGTTDGGVHWRVLNEDSLEQVQFVDSQVGWSIQISSDPRKPLPLPPGFHTAEGYSVLFMTTDGGSTWDRVEIKRTVSGICFVDERTGWVSSRSSILRTGDGGTSWTETELSFRRGRAWSGEFSCVTPQEAWSLFREWSGTAGTVPYAAFATTTGGTTWNPVLQERSTSPLGQDARIHPAEDPYPGPFDVPREGAAFFLNFCPPCGGTSAVIRTLDGGKSWKRFDLPQSAQGEPFGLSFVDENHGWAALRQPVSDTNGETAQVFILKTSDGGATWKISSVYRPSH